MDKSHILTIVIPVYNREQLVLNALDSIAIQEQDDKIKIIIVDDRSTDLTVYNITKWISNHPQLNIKLLSTDVRGVSVARNCGLKEVDTEFVMFFDSDDQMVSGFLNSLIDKLSYTHSDLIGWDVYFIGNGKKKRIFNDSNIWRNHLVHGALSTQRYVARASLFRKAGGWNESLCAWTDFELGVRLLLLRPKVEKLDLSYKNTINVYFTSKSITGIGYSIEPDKWMKSLDEIEVLISKYAPDKIGWVQYRRAILAAEFSRAGLCDYATAQLEKSRSHAVLPSYGVRLIFKLHKIFKRGTWLIARYFVEKLKGV